VEVIGHWDASAVESGSTCRHRPRRKTRMESDALTKLNRLHIAVLYIVTNMTNPLHLQGGTRE